MGYTPAVIVTKPHHVGISVESMERSLAWYERVLGFKLRSSTVNEAAGLKIVYIARDGYEIELFEQTDSEAIRSEEAELGTSFKYRGFRHLAFEVDDVDATWSDLQTMELDLVQEPKTNDDLGVRYCFIRDPDGLLIEFLTPVH